MSLTLADAIASGGVWAELGCSELLVLRVASVSLRASVRPPLIATLADLAVQFGPRKRLAALRVLAGVSSGGDARTAKLAARCLRDHGAAVRQAATKALAASAEGIDHDEIAKLACSSLCRAVVDRDFRVCAAAAKALPRLATRGDPGAVAAVSAGLRHSDLSVRRASIAALGEIATRGDAETIVSISCAAEADPDWGVRAAACRVLPRLAERGNAVAHKALLCCLKDPESTVRHVAMGAVVHISVRPSQHFIAWAPVPKAKTRPSSGTASKKGPPQQMMYLESPVTRTPLPSQKRSLSTSCSSPADAKKRMKSSRAVRAR